MANISHRIFACYNVRTSCMQLDVSIVDPNPQYNQTKREARMFLTMAPTLDKNVPMEVVKRGGTPLFNYQDKTVMKLETHEIAAFAKLKNPYFVRRYSQPALDDAGRQKTDQKGNQLMICDEFVHTNPKNNSITCLKIGLNQKDEHGIFVSLFFKQGQGYKNNIVYLTGNQTYEIACACEWALNKIWDTCGIDFESLKAQSPQTKVGQQPSIHPYETPTLSNTPAQIFNINDMLN